MYLVRNITDQRIVVEIPTSRGTAHKTLLPQGSIEVPRETVVLEKLTMSTRMRGPVLEVIPLESEGTEVSEEPSVTEEVEEPSPEEVPDSRLRALLEAKTKRELEAILDYAGAGSFSGTKAELVNFLLSYPHEVTTALRHIDE